jgi:hypothetical protein
MYIKLTTAELAAKNQEKTTEFVKNHLSCVQDAIIRWDPANYL